MIRLQFSPCPNDTFIFYAMTHGKVDTEGVSFQYSMADVEALNQVALEGGTDMIKVSYHAWLFLRNTYALLDAGSALGFGNGPLLISRKKYALQDLPGLSVVIPGEYTTANLLLKFAAPQVKEKKVRVFSEIEDAVLGSEADAGVIIHENRFTYEKKGLRKILDLGEYWEKETGLPVPLGAIVVKKSLGHEMTGKLNRIMKRSVLWAMEQPEETMEFVREHAQEMDEEVMRKHIALYVTGFTVDLGVEGKKAVEKLAELSGSFNREDSKTQET
jgi:1,4-dihydroxy-6-naphthoate synthase